MSASNQQSRPTWRSQVKAWLQGVDQQRWNFRGTLQACARHHKAQFPHSILVRVVGLFVRRLAVWLVKSAIKDAASDLSISMSDADADAIAEIAVTVILG